MRIAAAECDAVRRALDPPLRARAEEIPVSVHPRPTAAMREEGLDADLLGLFVGRDHLDFEADPLPPEILIFSENLWEYVREDAEAFREEIRRTYLHELGHYLGLNEDDLSDRELD
ncbi:MAG: metallopeptidase family protein [Kiritimatiellae bacterium]|nr:metallopeptidase family protein [Kiritimatiellia bacterium]